MTLERGPDRREKQINSLTARFDGDTLESKL
jgi:hypothetical protein